MPLTADPPDKSPLDALAKRIHSGIEMKGVHLVFEDELAILWNKQMTKSIMERMLAIRNFAIVYQFETQVSATAQMALFRKARGNP